MKRILSVLLVLLFLFALVGCSSKKATQPEKTDAVVETEAVTEAEKTSYGVGDSYENNGVKVTIQSCDVFTNDNEYVQPDEGNEYIRVFVVFENVGDDDKSVGTTNFDCYADGKKIDTSYLLIGDELTALDSISQGRKTEGAIYYEVPKGSKIELEYSTNLVGGDKIVFNLN